MSKAAPLRYRPYHQLDGEPNVVVDGAAAPGTVLTLSHWPGAPTVPGLECDLSAQMALAYAERMDLHGDARWVSNNHFDQDGLVSMFALVEPEEALARRSVLADELTSLESGGCRWVFDGVDMITPRLHLTGAGGSTIAPDDFRRRVETALAGGEPAWDPYG